MWGLVSDSNAKEIRQLAAARFLKIEGATKSSLIQYLTEDGNIPSSWEKLKLQQAISTNWGKRRTLHGIFAIAKIVDFLRDRGLTYYQIFDEFTKAVIGLELPEFEDTMLDIDDLNPDLHEEDLKHKAKY